jgi:hypothetical protein
MDIMSGEKFTNARVHEWLTAQIEAVTSSMHTTRIQLNSAALWWFCRHLTPKQRAEILGEYVKVQALGGVDGKPAPRGRPPGRPPVADRKPGRARQRKTGTR